MGSVVINRGWNWSFRKRIEEEVYLAEETAVFSEAP